MKNYYEILGLPNFATIAEVKKAFKTLAKQHHPDKNPDDKTAEDKFKLINEAHSILTNELAKANYDSLLGAGYDHQNIADLAKHSQEYRQKQQAKYEAYQDFLKRNAPKSYHVTNTQGAFLAILVVFYALSFANNLVNAYSRLQYWYALNEYEQKQYKKTVEHLEKSVYADHTFEKSAAFLGKIQLEKFTRYNEAIENITQAIKYAEKENLYYFYLRGLAFCHTARAKEAEKDFNYLTASYPDSLKLKEKIAEHYFYILKSDTLSTAAYKKIIAQDSTNHEALNNLGAIYYNHQNYALALDYFAQSIRRGNKTPEALAQRSFCYLALQNTPLACKDWQAAKNMKPELRHEVLDFFCTTANNIE
jgi:curved DNA-binding protein CbpA